LNPTARRQPLVKALEYAGNWQELHQAFAVYGLEIKPHGNGLAIKDRHGKHAVKASSVDRSLSLKKLEANFGPYQSPAGPEHEQAQVMEQSRYQAEPLHRSIDEDKERGKLYVEYKRGIEERKTR
jgi:prolyl-tRNA editing enzyme YbaK/EbsC (Cys-tRNA(Pro) deacylase)